MNKIISTIPTQRWEIISEDEVWRVGKYLPEFHCSDQVNILEKHSCKEFFLCVNDTVGLILYEEETGKETKIILHPGEAITVDTFHNGFRSSENGYFIVTEKCSFTTDFISRPDYKHIKSISE